MQNGIIFSCRAESYDYAVNEIAPLKIGKCRLIAPGTGYIETNDSYSAVSERIRGIRPVFIRHICPAEIILPAGSGCDETAEAAAAFADRINGRSFAIQAVSHIKELPAQELLRAVLSSEAYKNIKAGPEGEVILSVTAVESGIYIGFSESTENISPRAAGIYRYAFTDDNISRAEFKLLEAFEVFGIKLPPEAKALDLGAAPGGWTRILRLKNAEVTAVDPAELDAQLIKDPGITHYKGVSQNFIKENAGSRFDILVNDMRMDAKKSAEVTVEALKLLKTDALVIITLKLPEKKSSAAAKSAVSILEKYLDITGARQLYHNRSEITVAAVYKG